MKKLIKIALVGIILCLIFIFGLGYYIEKTTNTKITNKIEDVESAYVGIVLGAKVHSNGRLSGILKDRVEVALELYRKGKIKRFLLSGDHGKKNYDEVNSMKDFLISKGVPTNVIFLDHAGFDTYDSMYRAKHIFNCEDVLIFTQAFHLKRAVYLGNSLGLNAKGFITDKHSYGIGKKMAVREKLANVKAFMELLINKQPKFLGEKISITGSSKKSFD